jgi:hypothetical protein
VSEFIELAVNIPEQLPQPGQERFSISASSSSATVSVTKDAEVPTISIPAVDQIDCTTQTQTISVTYTVTNAAGVSYKWSTSGSTESTMTTSDAGTYSVTVTDNDNHCYSVTSVNVIKNIASPTINIPAVEQIDCATQTQSISVWANVTNGFVDGVFQVTVDPGAVLQPITRLVFSAYAGHGEHGLHNILRAAGSQAHEQRQGQYQGPCPFHNVFQMHRISLYPFCSAE